MRLAQEVLTPCALRLRCTDGEVQVTKHKIVWLGIVLMAATVSMTSSAADTCASLDACIGRMRKFAHGRDMSALSPTDSALRPVRKG